MDKNKADRIWIALTVLVLAALACQPGGPGPVTTPTAAQTEPTPVAANNSDSSPDERTQLVHATVQVLMQVKQGSQFESFSWGSGTIISADGMILTNAHVASPASQGEPENEPDRLVIALIESEDKPPVPAYIATVQAVDGYLDLAVLQITSTVDGGSVDTANLDLPFLQLGNPDEIRIGDHLNIYGFPSIGGETITYTDGNVSGFASDDQIGDRAWIKTDATISGGNSGGLAADDRGRIVGVPTSLGASGSGMDCRPQQDTNDDGQVNDGDFCVPISNFIADVRPINFAKSLIDAAQAGKEYASPYKVPGVVTEAGSGEEAATGFGWLDTSTSKDECLNTGESVSSYPGSALCIWTYFDYSGFTDGEQVHELWYNNSKTVGDFTYAWQDGAQGSIGTFLGNTGKAMPAGEYYLELHVGNDDRLIGTSDKVIVGNGTSSDEPSPPPQEDTISIFGTIYDVDSNKPLIAYVFILKSGISFEQWQTDGFPDSSLAASLQTANDGKYEITGIPRGISFTIVYVAEGYNIYYEDEVKVVESTPDRVQVDIGLTK